MKTTYYAFLLSATIGLFCGSAFVLGQGFVSEEYQLALRNCREANEAHRLGQMNDEEHYYKMVDAKKIMEVELMKAYWAGVNAGDDSDELPIEKPNGIRSQVYLEAHGDYTKLKLIVRSRKPDYNFGEPVWIKFYVRNDSDSEIHMRQMPLASHSSHFWKLFHSNYDEVVKTPKWEKIFQERIQLRQLSQLDQLIDHGNHDLNWTKLRYIKLQPGQECELDWDTLNDYYDLTKPDTYELTCFHASFLNGQYYETPLQSNTLTFRILEPTGEEPAKYPHEPQHIPYTNPPPGEEVFKQPKPPQSKFYIHVNPPGLVVPIDVSPTSMRWQWKKTEEAEAARAEAEKQGGTERAEE